MGISESRPWVSKNAHVHPDHVESMNQHLKEHGVRGAEFNKNGDMVAYSRKARSEALKACGYRDNDAGYGDYAGK